MAKIVKYNGGTQSYYYCSNPTLLIKGQLYEVLSENDRGWQTDYTLKGVRGEFNSVWFTPISETPSTYIALAKEIPILGKRCECMLLSFETGNPTLIEWSTSPVRDVRWLGKGLYQTTTINSVYIVKVE